MNVPSLVVLALVVLAAGSAIRYMIRHRGENGCGGCCGSCSGCSRRIADDSCSGCDHRSAGGSSCEECSGCSIAGVNGEGIEDEKRNKSTK